MKRENMLIFVAGISVAAFVNLLTGLHKDALPPLRIAAMLSFLGSAWMLFGTALTRQQAVERAEADYPGDRARVQREIREAFRSLRRWESIGLVIFIVAIVLIAVDVYTGAA
jgi:hypothetical protein